MTENLRTLQKSLQRAILQPWTSVQSEHQSRHQQWSQDQTIMSLLIRCKVAGFDTFCQRHCLTEGQDRVPLL